MLYRYTINVLTGKKETVATIYTQKENAIDSNRIAKEVFLILKKLKAHHYESYLVGGAVRDLLLKKVPKDFDIATEATPQQIRKIFSNSRVIGKRFKLCHVFYGDRIVEVSTFRSSLSDNFLNKYGNIREDVWRRDFSINALYYDPFSKKLYDYTGAMRDFKKRQLRSLIDLDKTFLQDPVRMVRAIKYSVQTGFKLTAPLKKAIKRDAALLGQVSISRMVEEFFKILQSGYCYPIFKRIQEFGLFPFFLSDFAQKMESSPVTQKNFFESCRKIDQMAAKKIDFPRSFILATLFKDQMQLNHQPKEKPKEIFFDLFVQLKKLLFPLTPSNRELYEVCLLILKENEIPTKQLSFDKLIQEKKKRQKEENEIKNS